MIKKQKTNSRRSADIVYLLDLFLLHSHLIFRASSCITLDPQHPSGVPHL